MSNELSKIESEQWSVQDIEVMADRVAKSRLFGLDASQAFTLMLLCQAEGIHPVKAVQRYHVIQGRPAMKSDAMLADFLRIGGTVKWITESDDKEKCEAIFSHPKFAPDGKTIRFGMSEAKLAGLTGNSTWQKYPANMLRARVVSNGVRMIAPGIVAGLYTPEEVMEFAPQEKSEVEFTQPLVATVDVPFEVKEHRAEKFPNNTGHGSGAYAPPLTVEAYKQWVKTHCESINVKWLDYLTDRNTGEISDKAPSELITDFQLSGHLLSWAKANKLVNCPDESRAGTRDKYIAVVWARDHEAVTKEATEYCRQLWRDARIKHKNTMVREPGDDDEISDDEAMDLIAKEQS